MDEATFWIFAFGFTLSGAIIGGSVCYALGHRAAIRQIKPAFDQINRLHKKLGIKTCLILTPRIGASRKGK